MRYFFLKLWLFFKCEVIYQKSVTWENIITKEKLSQKFLEKYFEEFDIVARLMVLHCQKVDLEFVEKHKDGFDWYRLFYSSFLKDISGDLFLGEIQFHLGQDWYIERLIEKISLPETILIDYLDIFTQHKKLILEKHPNYFAFQTMANM